MDAGQAREVFTDFRVTLIEKDNLRANVSCRVADSIWLTGIRVVEGAKGKFICMPCKKTTKGEYMDIFFPASREMREQLQCGCLNAYNKALAASRGEAAPEYSKGLASLVGGVL